MPLLAPKSARASSRRMAPAQVGRRYAGRSHTKELEHLGLVRRDRDDGITGRWKDLGGFPLPLHDARGDASFPPPLDLPCAELARVKEKYRLDAPRRGGSSRGHRCRRRPAEDEAGIDARR